MTTQEKWLYTMAIYDDYEKRFAKAGVDKPFKFPETEQDRQEIVDGVKKMLAFYEGLVPSVENFKVVRRESFEKYDVLQLHYTTWQNFHASGTLYMPHLKSENQKVPLGFVFCGHGAKGRLSDSYILMSERLAQMGMAVMLPDNIGQGDRQNSGHSEAFAPFYCGLTVQGMILMESVALIRYMVAQPWVDKTRVSACGNSGGGTLCLFLAALAPEIQVLCPTGYSSSFSYLLSKERKHCACNLLPGCAHGPQMWEILSTFAPKPLLIEQGENDHLIPFDLFMRTGRKVGYVYRRMGIENNFKCAKTRELHSWAPADRDIITQFIAEHFRLSSENVTDNEEILKMTESWHIPLPSDGLDTNALAQKLTGIAAPENTALEDIFKPKFKGNVVDSEDIIPDIGRGNVLRILAQMECALHRSEDEK